MEYFKHGKKTLAMQTDTKTKNHVTDDHIEMFRVIRRLKWKRPGEDRSLQEERVRGVIPLTDIWRPIQLVPAFGEACPEDWDCNNAVEEAEEYFVNSFWDKETYQNVF